LSEGGIQQGPGASTGAADAPPAGEVLPEADALKPLSPLMARVDVAVAIAIALIAAAVTLAMPLLIATSSLDPAHDFSTLPSSLIPRLAFGVLTVIAAASVWPALSRARSVGPASPSNRYELDRLRRAVIMALIAVAYAACVTWLGYILATMVMTAVLAFYLGLRNPIAFIPGVIIVPIVIRFVFERLLLISLPRSSIESVGVVEDAVMQFLVRHLLH